MKNSKRNMVRAASFAAAGVVVLSAFAIQGQTEARFYQQQMEYSYLRSLEDISSQMNTISADLNKSLYVGTAAQMQALSAKIWRQAGDAKNSLASLPLGQTQLDNTYRFLSQVGDYTMSLARKLESGQELTEEERRNLSALLASCRTLSEQVDNLEGRVTGGELSMEEIAAQYGTATNSPEDGNGAQPTISQPGAGAGGGENSFKEMESSLSGMPKLIYDGPFSNHIMTMNPAMLQDLPAFSQQKAMKKAALAAGVSTADLRFTQEEQSNMPSYCFATADGATEVGITKNGGLITYMMNSRRPTESKISMDEVRKIATAYLSSLGMDSMEITYYETDRNVCTINFAYKDGEVLCYTDLAKVGVAMDNGQVVSFDARGYISSHKTRQIESPAITEEEAKKSVSSVLKIDSSRLAVIPSAGRNDLLTYEFKCTGMNNQQVLVYINAATGAEEQILILEISDRGVLTI